MNIKKRDAKLRSEEESIKNQTKIDNIIKEEGRGEQQQQPTKVTVDTREAKEEGEREEREIVVVSMLCVLGDDAGGMREDGKRRAV